MTTEGGLYVHRSEAYAAGRPGYPAEVIEVLSARSIEPPAMVIDLGAGTGILSVAFARCGYRVVAVEPDRQMRRQGNKFGAREGVQFVGGTAENLPTRHRAADAVVVGQALHWFDARLAAPRIRTALKVGGVLLAVWNERCRDSDFERALEVVLCAEIAPYRQLRALEPSPQTIVAPYSETPWSEIRIGHKQALDLISLRARVASSSWAPTPGTAHELRLAARLKDLFDSHAQRGLVELGYEAVVLSTTVS